MKARKIVVPLDGSALAETALPAAIEIARANPGACITLVRAVEASAFSGRDPVEAQYLVVREAEEYLDRVAGRLSAEALNTTATVWYGPASSAIAEAAATLAADLIVMSTHGRSGVGRLLLGSVAESVLRATHTPILLLRPEAAPVARPGGRAEAMALKEGTHV